MARTISLHTNPSTVVEIPVARVRSVERTGVSTRVLLRRPIETLYVEELPSTVSALVQLTRDHERYRHLVAQLLYVWSRDAAIPPQAYQLRSLGNGFVLTDGARKVWAWEMLQEIEGRLGLNGEGGIDDAGES